MYYDFESSELSTVIGEAVEELDFNVVSLGVALGRQIRRVMRVSAQLM